MGNQGLTSLTALIFSVVFASCTSPRSVHTSPSRAQIDHVIVIVFDSLRPDFIQKFQMKNLLDLSAKSSVYKNAYVGYIGAETAVSHLVIPTGLKPKYLPWRDDIFYDLKGRIGKPGSFYSTGALQFRELKTLMDQVPKENYLTYHLKRTIEGKIFAVGQKDYAAFIFGTPFADSVITMKKTDGKCAPFGVDVPKYIISNPRYDLDCKKKYGTENSYYPLDGSRFVPGDDPSHQGGDIWVTDVALEVIRNENWSTLLLTYAGIDKMSHMMAEHEGPKRQKFTTPYSLQSIAKIADEQLGRLLSSLKQKNLLDRTLIVITSDHGGQANTLYLGNGKTAKWGLVENEERKNPSSAIKEVAASGAVDFSYQDSAMRIWLKQNATVQQRTRAIEAIRKVRGLVEIYSLRQSGSEWVYDRIYSALKKQSPAFQGWARKHNQELVNAMAAEDSPHLLGLLQDGVGFDLPGDHGGAQEKVQRIPLIVHVPGEGAQDLLQEVTLNEVTPIIFRKVPGMRKLPPSRLP